MLRTRHPAKPPSRRPRRVASRAAPLAGVRSRRPRRVVAATTLVVLLAGAGASGAAGAERIATVAGSGSGGFGGDGGAATSALLTSPSDVALLDGGAYLIADTANHRIRRVGADGTIATVAGAGPAVGAPGAYGGDGGLATGAAARLHQPRGVAPTGDGGFLIADTANHRIRAVSPAGVITTVAGNGRPGFSESDLTAVQAQLNAPQGVAAMAGGGFLIADTGNHRIRYVPPGPNPRIFTVAGTGTAGFTGDGGLASAAALDAPARAIPLAGGGFLIADTGNHRIRRVAGDGRIATVAGSGAPAGFAGDGGPATAAALNRPEGVAVRPDGSIAIADTGNERVREVDAAGTIRTIAGTGVLGFAGDGGPPPAAQLSQPRAVAVGGDGRLSIADAFNHRVRAVATVPDEGGGPPPPRPPTPPAPPRQVPPGVAPPVLGRTAVATPLTGAVRIRRPGSRRFVALDAAAGIPLGSELDAARGSVLLLFTTDRRGRRASAIVSEGRFVVRQPRRPGRLDRGQRAGTLVLSGPLTGCRIAPARRGRAGRRAARRARGALPRRDRAAPAAATAPRASAAARRRRGRGRRHGRRLRVQADGSIKTQGRYGAAIVRGTRWLTVDRCRSHPRAGTLVAVAQGRVAVRAFVLRRTVLVSARRRYLAPARRR